MKAPVPASPHASSSGRAATVNSCRSIQTASDWLYGRFPESGAISHSLAGFAHLLRTELGEHGKLGAEIGEGFRPPQNTKEGFGHVTSLQFRNTPITPSQHSLRHTQHPNPLTASPAAF